MALSGLVMVMGAPVSMVTRCGLSPIQHLEFRLLFLLLAYMTMKRRNEADDISAFSEV
jgi:hypothetical protein